MPERLHWILEGRLAGMALPGLFVPLPEDLAAVAAAGVRAVATLTEYALPSEQLQSAGLVGRHFPIIDFSVPTLEQVESFVAWVDEQVGAGRPVAAHCYAGLGRTGTMIACYLVARGEGRPEAVLERIRELEPGYVQTAEQEAFIVEWERHLAQKQGEP